MQNVWIKVNSLYIIKVYTGGVLCGLGMPLWFVVGAMSWEFILLGKCLLFCHDGVGIPS